MTQVKNVWNLSLKYSPYNISEEAKYRYDCIVKYKKLKSEGWSSKKAIDFLGLKRSTFFHWLSKFNKKCGTLKMKTTELEIYSSANAINAREFLKEAIKEFEFEIKSIQIDGGSEFMGEFEEYCEEMGIKLYVLPPRSPKMNGFVERANETYRYEFWNVYEIPDTIEETRKLLRKFEYKYNCERIHQSLNYLTPMEYYYKLKEKCA